MSLDNVPPGDAISNDWPESAKPLDSSVSDPDRSVDQSFDGDPNRLVSTELDPLPTTVPPEREYHPLDPRDIQVSRVVALIISLVLGVGSLIGIVIGGFAAGFSLIWMWTAAGGVLLLSMLISFLFSWPPIHHRHVRWRMDDIGLEIQRGVFWKQTISVPLARLQHADLTQGPLQRQWGLAKLTVYTAGTQHASVELDGLAYETAVRLRDRLLRQQGVGDVV